MTKNQLDNLLDDFENNQITPIYEKVKTYIVEKIYSGEWSVNHRVPSESELVQLLKCSRMTVNRALRELTTEGYLLRIQGVGTFVAENRGHSSLFEIKNIADEINERNHRHRSEVLCLEELSAHDHILLKMKIAQGSQIFHSMIVHFENDVPVQLENKYVNAKIIPDYLQQDFSLYTTNSYLVRVAPISKGEHIVKAVIPTAEQTKLLQLKPNEPGLLIERITWSNDTIISYSELLHPASRYYLKGSF